MNFSLGHNFFKSHMSAAIVTRFRFSIRVCFPVHKFMQVVPPYLSVYHLNLPHRPPFPAGVAYSASSNDHETGGFVASPAASRAGGSTGFASADGDVVSLKNVPEDRRLSFGDEELLDRSEREEVRLGVLGRSSTGVPDPRTLEMASRREIRRLLRLRRAVDADCISSCVVKLRKGLCA
jgi:hypothetical protein